MFRNLALIAVGATLALTAIACGDDDDDSDANGSTPTAPAATSTAVSDATAPPQPTPDAGNDTGVAAIDAAVAALLAGDAAALSAQAQIQQIACVAEPMGIGGPPICEAGEAAGTVVSVLPVAQCEGSYARANTLEPAFERLIEPSVDVYAIYRTPPQYYPDGPYSIVLQSTDPQAAGGARELILNESGIVGVNYGCAETPEQLVEFRRLTDAIVAPE